MEHLPSRARVQALTSVVLALVVSLPLAAASELARRALDDYHAAVDLYRARHFAEAEKRFAELAGTTPGPAALYLERCRHALADPLDDDRDGVYVALIK